MKRQPEERGEGQRRPLLPASRMSLQVLSDPKSIILAPSDRLILERRLVTSAKLRRNLQDILSVHNVNCQ